MASFDEMLGNSERHHLMLLYDDEIERSSAEIRCINKALSEGRYCVYATVNASHEDFLSALSAKIPDYDRYIGEGSLHIVNFMPFYESAAAGDLTLFNEMKARVEETLKARIMIGKGKKALLVADAACHLAKQKQFDECVLLESWWQETYNDWKSKNLDVTIICAHPSSVLKQQTHGKERDRISRAHSLTLDLKDYRGSKIIRESDKPQISMLVVEPESDIRLMYRRYLHSLPINLKIVSEGRECLQAINQENHDGYDIIVIDTHVRDSSGLRIAKKIIEENPNQQVIFTTTWDPETIGLDLKAHSLEPNKYAILHKPFMFSQLLGLIRPGELEVPQ